MNANVLQRGRMEGTMAGICVLGSIILAGCRTPVVPRPIGTSARPEAAAYIIALSNEVARFNQRMDVLEREWQDLKSWVQSFTKVVEEGMCKPIVEECLIGVPDRNGK